MSPLSLVSHYPIAIKATIQLSPPPYRPRLRRTGRVSKFRHINTLFEAQSRSQDTNSVAPIDPLPPPSLISLSPQNLSSPIPKVTAFAVRTPVDHWATNAQTALWEVFDDYEQELVTVMTRHSDSTSSPGSIEIEEVESGEEAVIETVKWSLRGRARVVEIRSASCSRTRDGIKKNARMRGSANQRSRSMDSKSGSEQSDTRSIGNSSV